MNQERTAWGCEYCFSIGPCNCEALIAQQDAEAEPTETEETDLGPRSPGDIYIASDGTMFVSRVDYLEYIRGRR